MTMQYNHTGLNKIDHEKVKKREIKTKVEKKGKDWINILLVLGLILVILLYLVLKK